MDHRHQDRGVPNPGQGDPPDGEVDARALLRASRHAIDAVRRELARLRARERATRDGGEPAPAERGREQPEE